MNTFEWSLLTAAGVCGLAGFACLHGAWKRPGRPFSVLIGWGLLIAGLAAGLIANGDRGLAQVCVIIMAGAAVFFAIPMARGLAPPVATMRLREGPSPAQGAGHPLLSGVWTFLLTGPVAGGIGLFAAAGLFKVMRILSVGIATAGALAIVLAVLVWAIVSVLLLIEPRAGRRSALAGTALAASAALAFIPV